MGLAADTDALVRASVARSRRYDGYTLVETPSRRDFHYGNVLVLDREPAPADIAGWIERHAAHFAGTGVVRNALVWERPLRDEPVDAADERERSMVFVRTEPLASGAAPAGGTIRELASDDDWSAAAVLSAVESAIEGEDAGFVAWRFDVVRDDARAGRARMWGLWRDAELLAYAGLYATDALARFATPVTRTADRRRGAFRALCATAVNATLERHPRARIAICAETGSEPEAIYRRLGFTAVGEQIGLARVPAPGIGYTEGR